MITKNVKSASEFCELRPMGCVIAAAWGTQSVFVCLYLQNVNLIIDSAKLNVYHKDLRQMLVCELNSSECKLSQCTNYPDAQN